MKPTSILFCCFSFIASFSQDIKKNHKISPPKQTTWKSIDIGSKSSTPPNLLNKQTKSSSSLPLQRNEILRRRAEAERLIVESKKNEIQYDFPSKSHLPATAVYQTAYQEIVDMLEGKKAMSLKQAVFITENAFYDNKYKHKWHDLEIEENVELIRQVIL